MKVLTVVKGAGAIVISVGIGAIAANLIKATTPDDTRKIIKACIWAGSIFVSGFAARAAGDRFGDTVDEIAENIKKWLEEKKTEEENIEIGNTEVGAE